MVERRLAVIPRGNEVSDYAITFRWNRTVQDRDWPKTNPSRRAIMAVAFIIGRYCDKDGSNIECSLNTITHKAGISRRTVIEVLKLLIAENLLQVDGKARGGVIRYRMILGGSEQRLNSTSIPTALCQKDENSTTTNDAVRDSLTLAHTADKKTTPPDNFTTIATSTITPTPPQAHDPELLRNDIREIYANRHVQDAIRKGEFTDLETLRVKYPNVHDAHDWIRFELYQLVGDVVDEIAWNKHFNPRISDRAILFLDVSEDCMKFHWKQIRAARKKGLDTLDDDTEDWFYNLSVSDLETIMNEYLFLGAEVIRAKYVKHHPQLDADRYETDDELNNEGNELGLTIDEDLITVETFNRDMNRYINEYNQTHQHA